MQPRPEQMQVQHAVRPVQHQAAAVPVHHRTFVTFASAFLVYQYVQRRG